jgi:hypothetical protein
MARHPTLVTAAIANLLAHSDDYKTGSRWPRARAQLRATKEAGEVVGFVWSVAYAHKELALDHWITQAEYAAFAQIDERTAQRHWERFRRAFPSEQSPERIARWILSEMPDRIDDAASATLVTAPDYVLAA